MSDQLVAYTYKGRRPNLKAARKYIYIYKAWAGQGWPGGAAGGEPTQTLDRVSKQHYVHARPDRLLQAPHVCQA